MNSPFSVHGKVTGEIPSAESSYLLNHSDPLIWSFPLKIGSESNLVLSIDRYDSESCLSIRKITGC
jgi:hypothetical protein